MRPKGVKDVCLGEREKRGGERTGMAYANTGRFLREKRGDEGRGLANTREVYSKD